MEEKRRGPGRPRKNEEDLANKYVSIRLTEYEKEWLDKLTKEHKFSISEFMRVLLNEEIDSVRRHL